MTGLEPGNRSSDSNAIGNKTPEKFGWTQKGRAGLVCLPLLMVALQLRLDKEYRIEEDAEHGQCSLFFMQVDLLVG